MVKSPLVGTFYTAPSEDADPFVQVGDQVKSGQTLAIVEAMKLMNEIESEYTGEIKEVWWKWADGGIWTTIVPHRIDLRRGDHV